jgi:hypothetical protein
MTSSHAAFPASYFRSPSANFGGPIGMLKVLGRINYWIYKFKTWRYRRRMRREDHYIYPLY